MEARRICRSFGNHDCDHLVLCDDFVVVMSLTKGRCEYHNILVQARKVCVLFVVCYVRIHVRRVASEFNPCDAASISPFKLQPQWVPKCGEVTASNKSPVTRGANDGANGVPIEEESR